ncbi:hypothetical protein PM082_020707 [Marasmius tenuissimus]|nr:hypothetical protein PM082_020707 [Marasmius tenuissimus]
MVLKQKIQPEDRTQSKPKLALLGYPVQMLSPPTMTELQACWELCRLHNNIGFWVVWLPTAWSIAMAYHAQSNISGKEAIFAALSYIPLCFGIKSLIMTIDDILDCDIDVFVERTKSRPLPRRAISLERAWLFFAVQVIVGVVLAIAVLDKFSLRIAAVISPLYAIYPTCKRWMDFAPIPLGVMFNIGTFMGWCRLRSDATIAWDVLVPVYVGACFWTCTYESVYQHQDKEDDLKIGLHSPALFLRRSTIPVCATTTLLFLAFIGYGGFLNNQGLLFYIGLACAGTITLRQLFSTNIDDPEQCREFFLLTPRVGQIILGGLIIDAVYGRFLRQVTVWK